MTNLDSTTRQLILSEIDTINGKIAILTKAIDKMGDSEFTLCNSIERDILRCNIDILKKALVDNGYSFTY